MKISIVEDALLLLLSWAAPIGAQQAGPFEGTRVATVLTHALTGRER